ncbi:MAG: hypothetical protein R3B60_03500 [Candidatus Paceibacterota bacterium]
MIDKKQIEILIRINGLTPTSAEADIKSVLAKAGYNDNDVVESLMILKGQKIEKSNKEDGLHKVFRKDGSLSSKEISQFLNIDISVDSVEPEIDIKKSYIRMILIILGIVAISTLLFTAAMYYYQIGIFHPAAATLYN